MGKLCRPDLPPLKGMLSGLGNSRGMPGRGGCRSSVPMPGTGRSPLLRGPAQPLTPLKPYPFMPAQPAKTSNSAAQHTFSTDELPNLHASAKSCNPQLLSMAMLRLCRGHSPQSLAQSCILCAMPLPDYPSPAQPQPIAPLLYLGLALLFCRHQGWMQYPPLHRKSSSRSGTGLARCGGASARRLCAAGATCSGMASLTVAAGICLAASSAACPWKVCLSLSTRPGRFL